MEPKTLQEAILYFSKPENCRAYLVARRWPDGVACPRCKSKNVIYLEKYNRWHCREKHAAPQFTLKTQTIFEDSPISLDKWLSAMWMIVNAKNGVSSWEIHRSLKVTQKSAWFMLQRLRLAMKEDYGYGPLRKIGGNDHEVEVDETFIGGQKKNMHKDKKVRYEARGGASGKTVVQGILDRTARQVRAKVMPNVKRETLQKEILTQVKYGTKVYTDSAVAYEQGMQWRFVHDMVDKTEAYVKGRVHVNGVENFWSLLKRGLNGTYVAVEPFHLFRYVDEQVFRFNNRATKENPLNDSDRFDAAVRQIVGKRLTYAELTGKDGERQAPAELF
jgi:transposase-like protein